MYQESIKNAVEGLRANEVRYFKNKYDHDFVTKPAAEAQDLIDYVSRILKEERDIVFAAKPVEATQFQTEDTTWTYVFYEDGLGVNALWSPTKRAVGFKLSDGMEVPAELADKFKFVRQKSKLAGTIRGSYFIIKGDY